MCTHKFAEEYRIRQNSKERARGAVAQVVGDGGGAGRPDAVQERERGVAEHRRGSMLGSTGGANGNAPESSRKTLLGR